MTIYSDIDFGLTKTEYGDIDIVTELNAVKQSLKNIILSKKGSRTRYQNPEFGSNVHQMLFEKINNITSLQIKNEITTAIENFEPRVKIIKVDTILDVDNNSYKVNIEYELINLAITDTMDLNLGIIT